VVKYVFRGDAPVRRKRAPAGAARRRARQAVQPTWWYDRLAACRAAGRCAAARGMSARLALASMLIVYVSSWAVLITCVFLAPRTCCAAWRRDITLRGDGWHMRREWALGRRGAAGTGSGRGRGRIWSGPLRLCGSAPPCASTGRPGAYHNKLALAVRQRRARAQHGAAPSGQPGDEGAAGSAFGRAAGVGGSRCRGGSRARPRTLGSKAAHPRCPGS
jgi:hypothetical protein